METMATPLRLAGVIRESIVDGPGWRFVVFAQGCPHHCPGCQNPQTHDFAGGYDSTVGRLIAEIQKNPLLSGVTLSGGDPFAQAEPFAVLAAGVHRLGLNVVTYTGWTYEQLIDGCSTHPSWEALLAETDVLVDGPFLLAEKSLALLFRGSRNQRTIDVKRSLALGYAVECDLHNGMPSAPDGTGKA